MASRWRRFAFFDRCTLSLPDDIWDDLVRPAVDENNEESFEEEEEEEESNVRRRFVFTSASVAFHPSLLPCNESQQQQQPSCVLPESLLSCYHPIPSSSSSVSKPTATKTLSICTSLGNNKNATFLSTAATTTANTPPALSPINGSLAFVYCFPNSKYQPMSPVLEKVAQHFFASCACGNDNTNAVDSSSLPSLLNEAANRLGVGTLVLALLSSKDTPLIHVVDVSMRCNPPCYNNDNASSSTNAATTASTAALADQLSAVSMEELEDLDGWRGCIAPFPVDEQGGSSKRIASIASYSTSQNTDSSSINNNMSTLDTTNKSTKITTPTKRDLGHLYVAVVSNESNNTEEGSHICILVDPHLYLHSTIAAAYNNKQQQQQQYPKVYRPTTGTKNVYHFTCIDIVPPFVAIGTSSGTTLLYSFLPLEQQATTVNKRLELVLRMEIPPPSDSSNEKNIPHQEVKSVKLSTGANSEESTTMKQTSSNKEDHGCPTHVFVCYRYRRPTKRQQQVSVVDAGVCCYTIHSSEKQPRSRMDLDAREISNKLITDTTEGLLQVCWSDGLYTYSPNSKVGIVQPIDGRKIAFCCIPSSSLRRRRIITKEESLLPSVVEGEKYALVATSDSKSGRDAVDIYDTTNKLCAFHVLLSPNHRAVQVGGVTTPCSSLSDGGRRGRSSAIVLTSGGAVVTLTEKDTSEKVASLIQKHLYAAAISLAFADAYYPISDIIGLYRLYAEHLYRKGDFEASMDQYIYTIGSLEPSHVIFRFLDAPKIPLLAKYLEQLLAAARNSRVPATFNSVHITELLRTCYLKLNDLEAAEKIITTSSELSSNVSLAIAKLVLDRPAEALASLCSLEAPQVAEALSVHGVALARSLPRETAGIVMSLCDGTYSPSNSSTSDSNNTTSVENNLFMENRKQKCERFPASMFTSAFIENSKLLRLVLAHCKRNHCELLPSLRRTHLELTLEEWNAARRNGDYEMEMIRSDEAITALTDTYAEELGIYEALVIVQMANFTKGEVLLFERLQMSSMLLEKYAKEGGERERRQMLAMCCSDPELLADVLSYFVAMASRHAEEEKQSDDADSRCNPQGEVEDIHDDIKEALEMARSQGVLPPVRIARILAGEGPGQFSSNSSRRDPLDSHSVPLSVALKYIGGVLDESSQKIYRLKEDLKEYCGACNSMEAEIASLLASSSDRHSEEASRLLVPSLDIDELCSKVRETSGRNSSGNTDTLHAQEEFWREMGQSSDRYDTIARFFGKLSID